MYKWNSYYRRWVLVAPAESATSAEQISYYGAAGYYLWDVNSYSGSGSYTFWLQKPWASCSAMGYVPRQFGEGHRQGTMPPRGFSFRCVSYPPIPVRACRRAAGVAALVVAVSVAHPLRTVAAAQGPELPRSRDVTNMAVFGTNVLLGGLTAAVRALVNGHDPARAFTYGALGGAVHVSGKLVGPISGFPGGIPGVMLSAAGTAIVSNAGRGAGLLDELYVPVGPLRFRLARRAPHKVRLAINAYEAGVLARNLARSGMRLDWEYSASSGTFAFVTQAKHIRMPDGRLVQGVAPASTIVISAFAEDLVRVARHEFVHVQQYWFLDEALGRPIEGYLRRRVPGGRHIPRWLELGIVPPALALLESALFGSDGPVRRLGESEAEMLEHR